MSDDQPGRTDRTCDERAPGSDEFDSPPECHRRGCTEPAAFAVLERYQEETGQGAVEARAYLCPDHTAEEGPANLDGVYEDYVFRVDPLPEQGNADES